MKYPNIDKMTDKELMLETRIMEIALEGDQNLPELIVELKLRGFVDDKNEWTQKAIDFDIGEKNES